MPGYFITSYDITDADGIDAYRRLVGPTLSKYGAKVLVAGPGSEVEGPARHVTIVIEFDSVETARAWYDDPEYQAILPGRLDNSTNGSAIIAPAFVPPT